MRYIAFLLFSLIVSFVSAQDISFYPKCDASSNINHKFYKLCYNEANEQANWVGYILTANQVNTKLCERTDDFRVDPSVKTGSATLEDYKGSGYDRGHLCPAADRHFSCDAISETFFMTNMSPQNPSFNRGIWAKLEEKVRTWAVMYDNIFVVTAAVLNGDKFGTIGANKVTIPKYYYKTVLRADGNSWTCIALVLPNAAGNSPWSNYVITVDSLEKLTKIDFYPGIPDDFEKTIESNKNISKWDLTGSSSGGYYNNSSNSNNTGNAAKQCTATTQKGTRCKRMTKSPNGKCWQHGGD